MKRYSTPAVSTNPIIYGKPEMCFAMCFTVGHDSE